MPHLRGNAGRGWEPAAGHGDEERLGDAAPAFDPATGRPACLTSVAVATLQRLAGNHSVATLLRDAALQRSGKDSLMPGLDEPGERIEKVTGRRGRPVGDGGKPPDKRQTRAARRPVADMARPRLRFTSGYVGPATQKLNAEQAMGFDQHAVLMSPEHAVRATASYYDFRQQVRDGFASYPPADTDEPVGAAFEQDGPFQPDYEDDNITVTQKAIDFHDHPGFSTDRKIGVGRWLSWYEARFQWVVREKGGLARSWTSPPVSHRIDSAYNDGADAAVTHASTADAVWNAELA